MSELSTHKNVRLGYWKQKNVTNVENADIEEMIVLRSLSVSARAKRISALRTVANRQIPPPMVATRRTSARSIAKGKGNAAVGSTSLAKVRLKRILGRRR